MLPIRIAAKVACARTGNTVKKGGLHVADAEVVAGVATVVKSAAYAKKPPIAVPMPPWAKRSLALPKSSQRRLGLMPSWA